MHELCDVGLTVTSVPRGSLQSDVFGNEMKRMFPILTESGSDSATLDNALQFLANTERGVPNFAVRSLAAAGKTIGGDQPSIAAGAGSVWMSWTATFSKPWKEATD